MQYASKFEKDVLAFHLKFGRHYAGYPRPLSPSEADFRLVCLQEELDEYKKAVEDKDLAAQFDALIDLVYFALGTAALQGFPFSVGWDLVHRANMKKELAVSPERSKRGYAFDIIKPADWQPPNLAPIIQRRYFDLPARENIVFERKRNA